MAAEQYLSLTACSLFPSNLSFIFLLLGACRTKFQNSLLCGLSGWVESQVEFPTFNERKKTVGFSFEELIRRKWRNLPSKKSPANNASLG